LAQKVNAPDGSAWTIRRRLFRRPRWRGPRFLLHGSNQSSSGGSLSVDLAILDQIIVFVTIFVAVVLLLVFLSLLAFLLELLLFPIAVFALSGPCVVEATN